MQRVFRVFPRTPKHVKDCLRSVDIVCRTVKVSRIAYDTGRIRFHIELANKYSIIPADELKLRLQVCLEDGTGDRTIERRALFKKRHVSLDFTLDCSGWMNP